MNQPGPVPSTLGQRRDTATAPVPQRAALIDTSAITANVRALRGVAAGAKLLAVLKADGYGHGIVQAARAALDGGADYLGTAVLEEAFAVREAGIAAPLFSWLAAPGSPYARAIGLDIDLAAYSVGQLEEIAAAGEEAGKVPRIHLKIDTGMWRGGSTLEDWPGLCAAALELERAGKIRAVGIWSHLACADEPEHPSVAAQLEVFTEAIGIARGLGLEPELCHIANSAATLAIPAAHFDMVRTGIAVYGVNPLPQELRGGSPALRPAMTLCAAIVQTKRAPAGAGISYGHTERHRDRDDACRGPARLRGRRLPQCQLARAGAGRRGPLPGAGPRLHGPVRHRRRRRRRGSGRQGRAVRPGRRRGTARGGVGRGVGNHPVRGSHAGRVQGAQVLPVGRFLVPKKPWQIGSGRGPRLTGRVICTTPTDRVGEDPGPEAGGPVWKTLNGGVS